MSKVEELTREKWVLGAFPEWGTWLNEEIDNEVVQPGTFAMWWIGCTGMWFKAENDTNIAIDLWFGNGKRTQKNKEMAPFHQMRNMTGGRNTQPNLRAAPIVYDPFAVTKVDAVLSTHYHNDHIDPFFAAAVMQNCADDVPFIGPKESVEKWLSYGVPGDRCRVVKPGDVVKVKDCEIVVLDSFDRTCLVTVEEDVRGTYVMNAQDLNMLAHLDDLAAAGIDSFKIEGRNKKAFYVASVVRAYRLALDGVPSSELADELLAVSHRPYGTGFYYGDARQSPDVDGYTAECRHAATVEACEPAGEGAFRVIARCYNRFCEGDELEALSPGPHVPRVRVRNLAWLPEPDGDDAQPKRVPVAVANRSAERYAFETGEELAPGDFLRMRINVER